MNLQNSLEMRVVDEAIILAELALQGSACPVAVTDLQIFLYFFSFAQTTSPTRTLTQQIIRF